MKYSVTKGDRYGRLTVKCELATRKKNRWVSCRCDCGNECEVNLYKLVTGHTSSCGCAHKDMLSARNYKHGGVGTSEYSVWKNMNNRCYCRGATAYERYGGRGISVCERWRGSFANFLADMGPKPFPEATLERIDNNGNYEPGNVIWASAKVQNNNKRNIIRLTFRGETRTLLAWCDILGVDPRLVRQRLKVGWDTETALLMPPGGKRFDS